MDIQCLQKVAETLEARAVANPPDVIRKKRIVTVLAPEVGVHRVSDIANASTQRWVVEDIDDGPRRIRKVYSNLVSPDALGSECLPLSGAPDAKRGALDLGLLTPHPLGGDDNGVSDYLLGQVPMLARRPPPNVIVRAEELRRDDPRVFPPRARVDGVKVYRCVETTADTHQPSSLGQICKETVRARHTEGEGSGGLPDGERPRGAPVQRSEESSVPLRNPPRSYCSGSQQLSFHHTEDYAPTV